MFDPFTTQDNNTTKSTETATTEQPVRKKRAPKHDFADGLGRVSAHRHVNGGGWVADTAKVADSVFVNRGACVYHHAVVNGNVSLSDKSQICGAADVIGDIRLKHHAIIGGRAKCTGHVVVHNFAKVYGGNISGTETEITRIFDTVEIRERPTIINSTLRNNCWIGGDATIVKSTLSGNIRLGGHAKVEDSTVTGYWIISNSVEINESSVTNNYAPHVFFFNLTPQQIAQETQNMAIDGSGTIMGTILIFQSTVTGPFKMAGDIEFIRADISIDPPVSMQGPSGRRAMISVDRNAKFISVRVRDYAHFSRINVSYDALQRVAPTVAVRGQHHDLDVVSRGRRIIAMEPK